ncbi:hypothetical protein EXU48_05485 [Occultella glacieicola]|uniref:Integral membrane protein n=1 Tax=Occultella glacieicola TaxID=2518684 RepID=A0ABY2E7T3_9MICO|nr:hypothetical protein [Occultella glacieicola]TDE97626.1 hypothetical protein EXU48_05485 [Occultella glacieicola]
MGTDPSPTTRTPRLAGAWVPPVALLSIGAGALLAVFVYPLVLLLAGIVLVAASPLWTPAERSLAVLGLPLIIGAPLWATLITDLFRAGSVTGGVWGFVVPACVGLGFVILAVLWIRGRAAHARLQASA